MGDSTFAMPDRPLTWFVTGSSSGFGLTLVRKILSSGHKVIATSRNPSRTPELVAEIEGQGGKWLKMDVDDLDSGKFIDELEKSGETIDVLVNNAGYSIFAPVETFTEGEVRKLMDTLYFGPTRLMRAILPYMRQRRFGIIVNMSSGAGLEGRASMGAYAPAKAALDGVSKVLAKEVAQFNIRVLIVSIGAFNTNMPNAAIIGENPLPDDYKGSAADQLLTAMKHSTFTPGGDQDKAMKALYEVVVGEGVGKGKESERFLPLGRDLAVRVKEVRDYLDHSLEVFGDVCNNVHRDE